MEEFKNRDISVEQLEKIVTDLELSEKVIKNMLDKTYSQLEIAREKLAVKRLENMSYDIPKYTAKLERIKKFIESDREKKPYSRINPNVKYMFKKRNEPYKDDFHDIVKDPLEYTLAEYNLLAMDDYIEIVFEYHSDGLKDFINKWFNENLGYAEFDEKGCMFFKLKTNS